MESKAVMNQEFVKLDRFDGTNFMRWKDKMMFLLTALKISYILDPNLPDLPAATSEDTDQVKKDRTKREEDELLCRGHILNNLSDRLYDLFTSVKSAKEIWNALEYKYNTEKQGVDKFLIMKYFEFIMVDNVSVMDQVHELQVLVSKLKDLKVEVPESLQVGAIIAKLPPSWNDYRKKLLHTTEDFSLEQIQKHLRIEEETRIHVKSFTTDSAKVNHVEGNQNGKRKGAGNKRKFSEAANNSTNSGNSSNSGEPSNSKKNKPCYCCGKKGHFKRECRVFKKQQAEKNKNNAQASNNANMVTNNANTAQQENPLVAMITDSQIGMVTELHMAIGTMSNDWWYDSGATIHVCNNKNQFKTYEAVQDGQEVLMGNSNAAKVTGKGSVELNFTSGKKLLLVNVLHVPEIRKNLISANLLCKKGFKAVIESDSIILSKNGLFVGKGYSCDGMFKLSINNNMNASAYMVDLSLSLWHDRLAHVSFRSLKYMAKHGLISYKNAETKTCEVCIQAKMTKRPFPKVERNSELLDLVHSDICELNGMLTRGGNRYFITFIDDYSKFTYVYLMKHKDQAFQMFKTYKSEVENQKGKKIKILRSDRGGEYFPMEFTAFCEENGIVHQTSAPYTPQQNGLAERKNRTLVDMLNSMLVNAKLPSNLWGEALLTACHLHNRIPSRKSKVSPYELWKKRKPNLSYVRVWGCLAFYKVPDPKKVKLGPRALKGIFVGYAENSKAYRILDSSSNVIVETRDVEFIENKFLGDSHTLGEPTSVSDIGNEPTNSTRVDPDSSKKRSQEDPSIEIRRSQRARKEKNLHPDFISSQSIVFLVEGNRTDVINKIPILLMVEDDPKTYKEAMLSRDSAFWKEAVNDEMDSLLSNNTWCIVDLPPGSKAIGCKWVFRRKYNTDGSIQTFKARLVAKGFRQKEGIDYFDTYAPVARITSIRVLLALSSIYNLYVHQMDVKTAFLNGDLDEEVYMEQPEGFVLPGNEHKVCKLTKSLYGLKQAPKQWHEKFDSVILEYGFTHNSADKCVYSKFVDDFGVIICLYVDDMLIISTNMNGINDTKKYLTSRFKMKNLGEVDTILGIKVRKHSKGFALGQSHYIEKVLNKFKHLNIKEASTPYDVSAKLSENSGRAIAQIEYASAIGSLMYAMHCTRPDIAFAVCKLSRYTHNPSAEHWRAIGRVLGYLKKTMNFGLFYNNFPVVLEGYTDASWITSANDNKSTSGWVFILGGGAVSWASKKQTCITHSTMESEFIALAAAGKEAEWLRNMLLDIKLWPQPMPSISLYCDSQATMSKAFSKVYNGKSRHISLRHEYVRELISNGTISIVYVKSCENLADPLTKGLPRDLIKSTSAGLGLRPFN